MRSSAEIRAYLQALSGNPQRDEYVRGQVAALVWVLGYDQDETEADTGPAAPGQGGQPARPEQDHKTA